MPKPLVGIIVGSKNDLALMTQGEKILKELAIPYELVVASAHRAPDRVLEYARSAQSRGLNVIIAAAGYAAHLAGVIASHTLLPVIAVPIDSSPLRGLDALLSSVMMPQGVPVATVTVGAAGTANAALLAAQILALGNEEIGLALKQYRQKMAQETTGQGQKAPRKRR